MSTATIDPPQTDETPEVPGGVADDELRLETSDQLSFDVGGKAPTSSTLRLTGGRIEVEGQFRKGQRVAVRVEAVVNDIGFKDQEDSKTGQVVGCLRNQKARIVGVHLLDD